MRKGTYKKRIEQACRDAGTYQPYFDDVIDTLAGILENRDRAQSRFKELKYDPVITQITGNGAEKLVKNPALVIITELNAQALTYWKDLGLTSKSFQAMQKAGFKKKETNLEDILERIGV